MTNHATYQVVALQQEELGGDGAIPANHEEAVRQAILKRERMLVSVSSRAWCKVDLRRPRLDVAHCGLASMWKDYQFATATDLHQSWGAQLVNVQLRFGNKLATCGSFEKWEVILRPDDADAVCWIDSSWSSHIDMLGGQWCSMFGCGLVGTCSGKIMLAMPRLSSISVMTAIGGEQPPIVDLFSGIGGWQWGNSESNVVSIEKDPAVIAVHAAQTGMEVIDGRNVDHIWNLDLSRLPVILNFDVRDRRWWIVFLVFRVLYATGSPPCVSWSGASHSAGLDHTEDLLFGETLAIGDAIGFPKIALENVAAILCHKHWRDLKTIIEFVMEMNLVVLKLDLQMFMPLKRLRAFFFISRDKETQAVEPRRTWA